MPSDTAYTIIIINWRTPELTIQAARSAQAMAADPDDCHLVIVDNASGDHSLECFARELPDARVVVMPGNLGFAKAVNAGLKRVQTPFALILNSDVTFRNDAAGLLIEALVGQDTAALACPKLLRPDGSLQAAAVPEPGILWELTNRSLPRHLMRIGTDRTQEIPSVVGPCMAVHMARISEVGLMDERFFFFFEETDWCRRLRRAGFKLLFVPAAEVVHLQGESANRRPTRARVQFYMSRYRYFRKHLGVVAAVVLAAGLFVKLTLDTILHGVLCVLTLGKRRHRDRLAVYVRLWLWHLALTRPAWGFEPADWLTTGQTPQSERD